MNEKKEIEIRLDRILETLTNIDDKLADLQNELAKLNEKEKSI